MSLWFAIPIIVAIAIIKGILLLSLVSVAVYLAFQLLDTPPNFNVAVDEYCDPIQPEPWGSSSHKQPGRSQDDRQSEEH